VFQVLIDVCGYAVKTLILLKRISGFIAMNYATICHRKTQKTLQDAFFNKDAMRKIIPGCSLFSRSVE
jgi:hypothetical protein